MIIMLSEMHPFTMTRHNIIIYVCPPCFYGQLLESERSREQLQQSLQAIDRSQKDQVQLDSLQGGLRHAEQEIARLENVSREQVCS